MSTELIIPQTDAWRDLATAARDCLAQLGTEDSRRVYRIALTTFLLWMAEEELTPATLKRSHMIAYQAYLLNEHRSPATGERLARSTVARMIASVRSVLTEYALATERTNPAAGLRPIKLANESTHVALSKRRVHELLEAIDRTTLIGMRDYAIVFLLVRSGMRRAECVALNVGDLRIMDGHRVMVIEHGKEDKRRIIKLQADIFKAIAAYMEAARRLAAGPEEPLFVQIKRGGHVQPERLGAKGIERIVKALGFAIGEDRLTPHGLRATSITRKLAAEAPIEKVAVESGHALIQTTQRYNKDKRDLEHTAGDYIHDLA